MTFLTDSGLLVTVTVSGLRDRDVVAEAVTGAMVLPRFVSSGTAVPRQV